MSKEFTVCIRQTYTYNVRVTAKNAATAKEVALKEYANKGIDDIGYEAQADTSELEVISASPCK